MKQLNKIFCSCGAKIEYEYVKPNFCSQCAKPLNVLASKKIVKKPIVDEDDDEFEDDEEETESFIIPSKKISLSVNIDKTVTTIKDVLSNPQPPVDDIGREPISKNSGRKKLNAIRDKFKELKPIEVN